MNVTGPWRILHVDTERTWRGGERQLVLLAREQLTRGHTPVVVCQPGSPLEQRATEAGLTTLAVPMRGEWDLLAAWRLVRHLRRARIDLLHLHTAHAHALGLWATQIEKVPVIVHRRVDFPVGRTLWSGLKYSGRVDRFVAVSEAVARVLSDGGVDPARIAVARSVTPPPARVDPGTASRLRRTLGLPEGTRLIGTVGHLADHKGHRYLIDAMPEIVRAIPEVRLLLVGEGELRDSLEKQVDRLELRDHVIFMSFREDAIQLIGIMDVFVHPSHMEGLGTSVMDAMWLERPVVVTAAGGLPEIVGAEDGWVVPSRQPAALAAAVIQALTDPAEARRRAGRGRLRVENQCSPAHLAEQIDSVYVDALASFDRR